jgi:hypothetical protein
MAPEDLLAGSQYLELTQSPGEMPGQAPHGLGNASRLEETLFKGELEESWDILMLPQSMCSFHREPTHPSDHCCRGHLQTSCKWH